MPQTTTVIGLGNWFFEPDHTLVGTMEDGHRVRIPWGKIKNVVHYPEPRDDYAHRLVHVEDAGRHKTYFLYDEMAAKPKAGKRLSIEQLGPKKLVTGNVYPLRPFDGK